MNGHARALAVIAAMLWAIVAHGQTRPTQLITVYSDGSITTTQPAADPTTRPAKWLGVNLEAPTYYGRQAAFADAARTCSSWGLTSTTRPFYGNAPTDGDGLPTTDAAVYVLKDLPRADGIYAVYAKGRATIGAQFGRVLEQTYDAATDTTAARVQVNAGGRPATLVLTFTNTAGGIRGLEVIRPGYARGDLFTREFLEAVKPFDVLRAMDWARVVHDTAAPSWPDERWNWGARVPYRVQLELATAAGKDVWLCVPVAASDDWIRQLIALAREAIPPGRRIFLEYGNELWNGQFKATGENARLAKADVAAGDTTLNLGGTDANTVYWAWRRIARRGVEIRRLIGPDDRFSIVLASMVGWSPPGFVLQKQLDYVKRYHGEPRQFFGAVALAPYVNLGIDPADPAGKARLAARADLTVDRIIETLAARANVGEWAGVRSFTEQAHAAGLESYAYEAGVDLEQLARSVAAKIAAQTDARQYELTQQILRSFYANGADGACWYTATGLWNQQGYWALTDDITNLTGPKYRAAADAAAWIRATRN